ncbi:hypothetical protein TPA0910_30510 [Streptomyces hygroscopicus subsp. sporocinereus]|uniref:DUF488 domain-containing protein n=1 Tax=Streptomyces hygroscopicus TaxID=1912 RepID=A0ABQ3TZ81_STRHY|nr:DUF488 family protein [Streptomyces hygroscopicus]GHJ28618.1 hypothetical protein TPA0910_30510 [Streptomyces hygroscopicus]
MITLFTNRYQTFQSSQGIPVRITLGAPRFKLAYSLTHVVRELAPRREYFSKPLPEFTSAYGTDLDRLGAAWIAARLQEISEAEKEHRLVLLCFEDLTDPAQWCHRRIFAKWWKDATGDEVRELGPLADRYEQGTLM